MNVDEQKRAAAQAALDWLVPRLSTSTVVGVGTGSTADHFIDLLAAHRARIGGTVASSTRSAERLVARGIPVHDLNDVAGLAVYIDGADEITADFAMTKGGGGALTREKIVAAASETFVCIADASKRVTCLGAFPLPVEVIPMARVQVGRALDALGRSTGLGETSAHVRTLADGKPYMTDNGNLIMDVRGWRIEAPSVVETDIDAIVGVVECGLFARRGADLLMLADAAGVRTFERVNK